MEDNRTFRIDTEYDEAISVPEISDWQAELNKRYEALETSVRSYNPTCDFIKLRRAFEFSRDRHGAQLRKDGSPYITHPIATALIVADMGLDDDSLISAMLHDVVEDTKTDNAEIEKLFGSDVALIVDGVTKLTRLNFTSHEQEQMENLRKMFMAMARDIRVMLIKVADRLHNMRTMEYHSEAKQREKSLETLNIYAPITHRLGMQKIKWELEDLSLRYLEPNAYENIKRGVEIRNRESEGFLEKTTSKIRDHLLENDQPCDVYGRVKHIYSIYRKMHEQNKTFEEILDLYAFRVVVNTIGECYRALGLIHQIFAPVPDRWKDYINMPKPNGYQSIHTTVIGGKGIPFEVQIRTHEMHVNAEYGVAAHWKYKHGIAEASDEERYAWIRRLLESQQDSDPEEFFQALRTDMFADEIFVFTPRGDVISLPAGATPIDLAYAIHSEIGNRMTGALVNKRMVPYSTSLQNGDIVEILTSKASSGPSRDWLNLVKSSEARNKIRQWFKREKREENAAHGKTMFESELKRAGFTLASVTNDDTLDKYLKKLAFPTLLDMYAAIGYGGVSAQKCVNKIREEALALQKAKRKDESEFLEIKPVPVKQSKTADGVIVDGLAGCLIKYAKCCTPVPGDDIAGFITKTAGVSVHRRDCLNYQKYMHDPKESGRCIGVSWAHSESATFSSALIVKSKLYENALVPIMNLMQTMRIHVSALSASDTAEGSLVTITVDVHDSEELRNVTGKLAGLNGVFEVRRA